MISIVNNLKKIHQRVAITAESCGRDPTKITLVAVSKTFSISLIKEAVLAGQSCFGENYVQEGVKKIQLMRDLNITWHFIGKLQSNKSHLISKYFDWCQTIDRLHIATRLNEQRSDMQSPLKILIQINISNEKNKAGISLSELFTLAQSISKLPRLQIRGLMAIPAIEKDSTKQIAIYQKVVYAFKQLQKDFPNIDTLSLGMSNDMDAAIIAGSTMLRIGTAIFGARNYRGKLC